MNCEYCHWKRYKHYDINDIKKSISRFLTFLKYKKNNEKHTIYIHGGEPSFHPDIIEIMKFLYDKKIKSNLKINIEFQTNLTMDLNLYQELSKYIDYFSITLHYNELRNHNFLEKFKNNCYWIFKKANINNFDIMLEYFKNEKEKYLFYDYFLNNFYHKIKKLKINNEMIYSFCHYDKSIKTIKMHKEFYQKYNITEQRYGIYLNNNLKHIYNTNDFFYKGLNCKNWMCEAGKNYIVLNGNGDVFLCGIHMTQYLKKLQGLINTNIKPLFNILNNDWRNKIKIYLNKLHKCKWTYCGGDFYIPKYKKVKQNEFRIQGIQ